MTIKLPVSLKIKLTKNSKRKVTNKFEVKGAEKVQIVRKVSLLKKYLTEESLLINVQK